MVKVVNDSFFFLFFLSLSWRSLLLHKTKFWGFWLHLNWKYFFQICIWMELHSMLNMNKMPVLFIGKLWFLKSYKQSPNCSKIMKVFLKTCQNKALLMKFWFSINKNDFNFFVLGYIVPDFGYWKVSSPNKTPPPFCIILNNSLF